MRKAYCYTTQEKADKFEMIYPLINSMAHEMKALSTKKADGALNKLKITMINKLIVTAREILSDEPSLNYLEILDEETLPQNSDVTLILYQYTEVLHSFHKKHYDSIDGWYIKK